MNIYFTIILFQEEKCKFKEGAIGATLKSWIDLPPGDEVSLQTAVATVGPVSVAIDASQFSFQFYR